MAPGARAPRTTRARAAGRGAGAPQSRTRCRPAPSRSSGSSAHTSWNAAIASSRFLSFSRSSPSANHADAKRGAASIAWASRSAAPTRSPRAKSSCAIAKRRSAMRSPEDWDSGAVIGARNVRPMAYVKPMRPHDLLVPTPAGLCCPPGGFHIDPLRPVDKALITHGHSDHARPGHGAVLATPETLDLMRLRHGDAFAGTTQAVRYGEPLTLGGVAVSFHPAGHVLGSAQISVAHNGLRMVASGDYKDVADPTCAPFELVPCDVFITEATFGLPVFRHGDPRHEIDKLVGSVALFPERAHLVGAYSLGKTQRVIALIRAAGYDAPIYLHGAMEKLTRYYQSRGVALGELRPVRGMKKADLPRTITLAPPSAT